MVAYNGNLAVTCGTRPETTKLVTIDGGVLWSVCIVKSGPNLFDCHFGITITSITDTTAVVVVSDLEKDTLTLLEAQTGTFIRSIDVGKGRLRLIVMVMFTCVLLALIRYMFGPMSDFQESKILLSSDKLDECPHYIVYSAVDDSLYVYYGGYSRSCNKVDSFRLV